MNVTILARLRHARWVHAVQLVVFTFWVLNPFPGAHSYWTDSNGCVAGMMWGRGGEDL